MFNIVRALGLLVLLYLTGCETLSRSECQTGDWYDIGVRDGANGRSDDRFLDNAKACAKHGIAADRDRWLEGRERGLERYCTPQHAFEVGAASDSYQGVCVGPVEDDFLHGYHLGRSLAQARDRRSHWDNEIHQIRHRLDEAEHAQKEPRTDGKSDERHELTNAERVELAFRLGLATVRRDEADHDVAEIERHAQRL